MLAKCKKYAILIYRDKKMTRAERMKKLWRNPKFKAKMKHRTRRSKAELRAIKERLEVKRARRELKKQLKDKVLTIQPKIFGAHDIPSYSSIRKIKVTIMKEDGTVVREEI